MSNLFDRIVQKNSPGISKDDKGGAGEPPTAVVNHEKSNERLDQSEHSPHPQQQTHISPSKHDRVLEVDSLRTFTIPKARKQKREQIKTVLSTLFNQPFV